MTPTRSVCLLLAALAAAGLGGCAAGALSQGYVGADSGAITTAAGPSATDAPSAAPASADEAEADCKRMAGKVQLRLLEVRSGMSPEESSIVSRSIQTAGSVLGGSTRGLNPETSLAHQVAELETANAQLAERNCRSFDIAKALTGEETVPAATIPPKKQAAR
jgi:hypothetical protein